MFNPDFYPTPLEVAAEMLDPLDLQSSEQDIAREFHRIFDSLASSQVELDAESKEILYANLWDLYT